MKIIALLVAIVAAISPLAAGNAQVRRPALAQNDIADITTLVMLEDRREFDSTALSRILGSSHPEVRRRAAQSIGRIVDPRGRMLLRAARGDADTAVAATIAFATGQLHDTAAIGWLDSLMNASATPPGVATEAAGALGKIRTPETRAMLARYLASAPADNRAAPVVGEALLSIGRSTIRGADIAPIVRWISSADVEIRWRATWALFRPRDHAAIPHLLRLTDDSSPLVRNWAVRALLPAQLDSAGIAHSTVIAQLARLTADADRAVRTQALGALAAFPDTQAVSVVLRALASDDTWLSVSAAEGLARHQQHAATTAPRLAAVIRPGNSSALQVTALASLNTIAPESVLAPASVMARDSSVAVRVAAVNALRTRGTAASNVLALLQGDPVAEVSGPARNALTAILAADSAARAVAASGATTVVGGRAAAGGGDNAGARARGAGRAGGRAGRGGGAGRGTGRGRGPVQTSRTEADYRQIVERWIVPDYNGAARPVAEWVTSRGTFRIELYPGDAPIGVADFFRNVESGSLAGVVFSRLVPDFVAQQRGIPMHPVVRDEVSRKRLTRANVSWASAGLDTGRPGYTLGHTPQPHNQGSFTALGRIVTGMDVVDRLELGDRVLQARIVSTGR